MKSKKLCLGLSLITLLGTTLVTGCSDNKAKEGEYGYVTIETNPSVELVIGEDNIVVSVNGLNEDGKLLLSSEDLEGLSIEEATQKIIELTEQLGFTVQGTIDEQSQEIKVSVSATNEKLATNLQEIITSETQKAVEELDLDAVVVETEAKTREYLESVVLEQFPTLTQEEVAAMTNEELYSYIDAAVAEKALFASVKLEEYYQDLKEYEFKLKYKEELAASLSESQSVIAQALHTAYSKVVTSLHDAITKLQEMEVEFLTSPDSSYVKALNDLNAAKDEVIGIRVELGARENKGFVTETLITALNAAETTLNACGDTLAAVETAFTTSVNAAITAIETVLSSLEVIEAQFPKEIDFAKALSDAETYINDSKNAIIAKFESSFEEGELAEIKQTMDQRKQALETLVASKKEEVNKEATE